MPRATRSAGSPLPVNRHVGARLQQRRQALGLSRRVFGKKVGIAPQQVQKYERGTNALSAHRLFQFAGILGVRVGYFFKGLPRGIASAAPAEEAWRQPSEVTGDDEGLDPRRPIEPGRDPAQAPHFWDYP
jgi:transcriptional regulator with XRE-family HTH domain